MSVTITATYPNEPPQSVTMTNADHERMVILGAYTAVGVMCSPDAYWWYSERFKYPSAHGGMRFQCPDTRTIRMALETIHHGLKLAVEGNRDWITDRDRQMVAAGTYDHLILLLNDALVVDFS